jgi:hypothetical protein
MTDYVKNAIANLEKQATKLRERVLFYASKEEQAQLSREQHEEQYEFIQKQIASLKGETVNGEVKA